MPFVIYVSSEAKKYDDAHNAYGYWLGKFWKFGGDAYPACIHISTKDNLIEDVKKYKSRKRAEAMAEKIFERCGFVMRAEVEEID